MSELRIGDIGLSIEAAEPTPSGKPVTRIGLDSEKVGQGLGKLVLTLVELVRELLERQAIRRMESGQLTDAQIEELGLTFLQLKEQVDKLRDGFGLQPEDLNLDLGPLGKLL